MLTSRLKIAFVGIGSIARRHVKNVLRYLQQREIPYQIDAIRSGHGIPIPDDIKAHIKSTYIDSDQIPDDYDIMFITTPTALHFETIKRYSRSARALFIEKPVFDRTTIDIQSLLLQSDRYYYVACPLRYTNVVQFIRENVDPRSVFAVRAICSSYLPDWRPGLDYRNTYSAKKSLGGGVSIDLIHEMDYLIYLFGFPERMMCMQSKVSDLEIDSDDFSAYVGRSKETMIELHLDYFGRHPQRQFELFTKDDVIVADLLKSEVRFIKNERTISLPEERNDYQLREIEHFFSIIDGKTINDNDICMALKTLSIAKGGMA